MRLIRVLVICLSVICMIVYTSGGLTKLNLKTQRTIMRLVRDISRHKARQRLQTSHNYALVPLLLGQDSATDSQVLDDLMSNDDRLEIISRKELTLAKGLHDEDDLWIAILGHVFDVREGAKFYGKGGAYEMLAGRDATKALASGDLTVARDFNDEDEIDHVDEDSFDKDEMAEAKRWLEYFASHQKYKHIGRLRRADDLVVNIDDIVGNAIELEENVEDSEEEDKHDEHNELGKTPPKWHPPVLDDNATCPGGGNSK